jgi:alpha-tubulin suppressor-like RCC1 family protein
MLTCAFTYSAVTYCLQLLQCGTCCDGACTTTTAAAVNDTYKLFTRVGGALEGIFVTTVNCGYYHTLMLGRPPAVDTVASSSRVYACGRCDYGQCGLGYAAQRVYGVQAVAAVDGKGVVKLATGCYHSIMVCSNGMLYGEFNT